MFSVIISFTRWSFSIYGVHLANAPDKIVFFFNIAPKRKLLISLDRVRLSRLLRGGG